MLRCAAAAVARQLPDTGALTRCARSTQCGEIHAAALLYLRADTCAFRGDYCSMLALAELPVAFRTVATTRCCFHGRLLLYLASACEAGRAADTVAADGLEFAAHTLECFAACKGAALKVAQYVALASGHGQQRRALNTGMLPQLITYLKETIRRADEDEAENRDAEGVHMVPTDAAWTAVSRAFMNLAGCCCDGAPHPAGGTASTPQPQVIEELLKAGLPRLYLSRAVELAQHAHKRPELDWLTEELRVVGHVFRACVLFAVTPRQRDPRLLMTVVAALRANPHVDKLLRWALRYCFVPLAYAEITRKKGGNIGPAFVRAGCRACRLACCAPPRSLGNAPETLAALHAAGALPVVLAAAEQHRSCRRSAARLLAYLVQGDFPARKLLNEHGAAEVMLRVHADEKPYAVPAMLEGVKEVEALRRLTEKSLQSRVYPDTDALELSQADGCALSECDCDDVDTSSTISTEDTIDAAVEGAKAFVERYLSRMELLTRAVCALADAPDVRSVVMARASAAADDIAAHPKCW